MWDSRQTSRQLLSCLSCRRSRILCPILSINQSGSPDERFATSILLILPAKPILCLILLTNRSGISDKRLAILYPVYSVNQSTKVVNLHHSVTLTL
jgi:hypothetical protein